MSENTTATFEEQQEALRKEQITQLEMRAANHWQPLESAGQLDQPQRELWQSEQRELQLLKDFQPAPPAPASLLQTVNVGTLFSRAISGQVVSSGPELELLQELNMDPASGVIPFHALVENRTLQESNGIESRATGDVATSLTLGDYSVGLQAVLQSIFKRSISDHLMVAKPSIPRGEARFPVIGTAATADAVSKNTQRTAAAVGFSVKAVNPTSVRSKVLFAWEDAITWGEDFLQEAIRANMALAVRQAVDDLIVAGKASAPDFDGILDKVPSSMTDSDPADALNWNEYREFATKVVDGKLAASEAEGRIAVGPATWRHMRTVFRSASIDSLDAADELQRLTGNMMMASAHIVPASSNIQKNIVVSDTMAAVSPMWPAVRIVDRFTESHSGQTGLVLNFFIGFDLLRTDGYAIRKSYIA